MILPGNEDIFRNSPVSCKESRLVLSIYIYTTMQTLGSGNLSTNNKMHYLYKPQDSQLMLSSPRNPFLHLLLGQDLHGIL